MGGRKEGVRKKKERVRIRGREEEGEWHRKRVVRVLLTLKTSS